MAGSMTEELQRLLEERLEDNFVSLRLKGEKFLDRLRDSLFGLEDQNLKEILTNIDGFQDFGNEFTITERIHIGENLTGEAPRLTSSDIKQIIGVPSKFDLDKEIDQVNLVRLQNARHLHELNKYNTTYDPKVGFVSLP